MGETQYRIKTKEHRNYYKQRVKMSFVQFHSLDGNWRCVPDEFTYEKHYLTERICPINIPNLEGTIPDVKVMSSHLEDKESLEKWIATYPNIQVYFNEQNNKRKIMFENEIDQG